MSEQTQTPSKKVKCVTTEEFISSFKKYHSDRMFKSYLEDVGCEFIAITGRTSISGILYTTLCLLLAQAMTKMLNGYNGGSVTDKNFLSEAIGFHFGNGTSNTEVHDRYQDLVSMVHNLQLTEKVFADTIDDFIK